MAVLSVTTSTTGLVGVEPRVVYILTNNSTAEVLVTGYLNKVVEQKAYTFTNKDMALVYTTDGVQWMELEITATDISLKPAVAPGTVVLPVTAGHIAAFVNTDGAIGDDPATAINGGNLQAGLSGTAGYLASFPATAARGSLRVVAANNAGDTITQITNASQAAARVYTIPDGGQAASSFLLTDNATTQTIATGSLALTLGNVTVAAGDIEATLGRVSAGTTVTAGTGITSTTGNITASAGNVVAGNAAAAGAMTSFAGTGANEFLRVAAINNAGGDFSVTISNASSVGQSQTISIPDAGAATANFVLSESLSASQTIASGLSFVGGGTNIQITGGGNFIAGASGAAGAVYSYPVTAANGSLGLVAVNAGADFDTTISNAASVGQDQVITIPDSGAATANFLLDTGAANILTQQQFVGLSSVLAFSVGTWTTTRIALGNYGAVKTQANETAIIGVDITPMIRTAASKGFRLDSFDVIYGIATLALDAHSVTLSRVAYANNVAVSVTSIPVTATLATATQANPYVTNAAVDTPAFDVTADSKYVIEVTVDAGATSDYTYYGIMLRFSQTIA